MQFLETNSGKVIQLDDHYKTSYLIVIKCLSLCVFSGYQTTIYFSTWIGIFSCTLKLAVEVFDASFPSSKLCPLSTSTGDPADSRAPLLTDHSPIKQRYNSSGQQFSN